MFQHDARGTINIHVYLDREVVHIAQVNYSLKTMH